MFSLPGCLHLWLDAQSLPSFGPYLVEKNEIIASYKKKIRDAGATTVMEANTPRVSTPTKPVPAVKVSCIQTYKHCPAVLLAVLSYILFYNMRLRPLNHWRLLCVLSCIVMWAFL